MIVLLIYICLFSRYFCGKKWVSSNDTRIYVIALVGNRQLYEGLFRLSNFKVIRWPVPFIVTAAAV
jgi:hypothetical protein